MGTQLFMPATRLEGEICVPGDKSISHRALILASMGAGECLVSGLSPAEDVHTTEAVLRAIGAAFGRPQSQLETEIYGNAEPNWQILVRGDLRKRVSSPQEPLDCGNSGTTMRTIMGVLAGLPLSVVLDGDESLKRRPMERVAKPLREMGAQITTSDGRPPVRIDGGALVGRHHELAISSAQVKTAILLAGLFAEGTTSVSEPRRSRDHTERLYKFLGIQIEESPSGLSVKSTQIQNASEIDVPGDISSAAFIAVSSSILEGSDVTITNVGVNPTRTGILDLLEQFGAVVEVTDRREMCREPRATIRIRPGDRRPLTLDAEQIPGAIDEVPLVAVLGALAEGTTTVVGAGELRLKESDRITTIAEGLGRMGADITTTPDGFVVRGGRPLRGAEVDSAGDHRIGMALAVAALAAEGPTSIRGWEAVGVSYPGFERALGTLAVPASLGRT